ncbi:glycosyltransferase [Aequorivita sp. SDUM287046]|uniref:Glycosyltransferase n=1 Tax=Aequorivita aurantiaca TaxID=3053356 RepID=A0ABT8DHX6_9FLAO|nr:glycosyltransferase [Aequorivita aurantiaca]MDN3725011.1 glycosyltransferase [Aequorivita aurantiaca]
MHILIVDWSGPIPALKYGGTERVIWGLGKYLYELGHSVTFLVPDGFTGDFAKSIPLDQTKDLNSQIPDYVDLVHFNYPPRQPINKPYIITMHGNPKPDEEIDKNTVFISRNQAARYNSNVFVHNGLYWDDYGQPNLENDRRYFHFLGKVSRRVKNVFGAARIVSKANGKLLIMGGDRWTFRNITRGWRYIFNPKIMFLGMLDDAEKMKIMEKSKALVFPVEWHEPFGLVIIESLYAGCSVFCTTNGSLPELLIPEVGLASNDSEELAAAIRNFRYNPTKCHEYARDQFNAKKMTFEYLKIYEKVIAGENLHSQKPTFLPAENNIKMLS